MKLTISIPSWMQSKIFWLAFITILIEIGNSAITSSVFPGWENLIAWVVGALGFILTAISGASAVTKAQSETAEVKAELVSIKVQVSKITNPGQ